MLALINSPLNTSAVQTHSVAMEALDEITRIAKHEAYHEVWQATGNHPKTKRRPKIANENATIGIQQPQPLQDIPKQRKTTATPKNKESS